MKRFLDSEIAEIRKKVDIKDIIADYIPIEKKGKDYRCICPFHNDHSPSMNISSEKQIYKCFACGASGNVFSFIQNYESVSFGEAVQIVAKKIGFTLSGGADMEEISPYKKEYEVMELATKYYQNNLWTKNGVDAKEYLSKRGITDEIINTFKIGVGKEETNGLFQFLTSKGYDAKLLENLGLVNLGNNSYYDMFSKRITFPLWDSVGHVVGFSARIYHGEDSAKYINTKETYIYKKGNYLFNYHNAKNYAKTIGKLIVVEGQMDAIRVYSSGIKYVVAQMGTALTKEQIELIKKTRATVILCLDNDDAGAMATIKNGDLLTAENVKVKVIRLSGEKDPDEYILKEGVEAFQKNVDTPLEFFDFKMQYLKKNIDEGNSEELSGYINSVLESLGEVNDPILREITLNKLSKEYSLDVETLKKRVKDLEKVSVVAKEVFSVPKVSKKETNYDKIAKKVLLYMMTSSEYIKMYQNELGYFDDKDYRMIANELVYYVKTNGTIEIADFISYMTKYENLSPIVTEIASLEEEMNKEYFKLYLTKLKKMNNEKEIERLKKAAKQEMDKHKQIEIAKKIIEMKKGCVE